MTYSSVCFQHNAIHSVLRGDDEVFKFVLGNECFRIRFKTGYDGWRDKDLMEFQIWDGLPFCFKFLLPLKMKDRAAITLERLCARTCSSVMRVARGLAGWAMILLMVFSGSGDNKRNAHFLMGQESSGWMRKLPCSQKSDLIWPRVEPDLVSRSPGLREPGHQNQSVPVFSIEISMTLVP